MIVACVLCQEKTKLDAVSYEGKRLINHPLATYMCASCTERITRRTEQRRQEGKLPPTTFPPQNDDW